MPRAGPRAIFLKDTFSTLHMHFCCTLQRLDFGISLTDTVWHVRFKVSFEDVFAVKKHHTSRHDNAKRAKRAKQQVARVKFV